MKRLIVEPHADDALLSLSGLLKNSINVEYTDIITLIDNGSSSKKLMHHYDVSTVTDFKLVKPLAGRSILIDRNLLNSKENKCFYYESLYNVIMMKDSRYSIIKDFIHSSINLERYDSYDEIYVPFGLLHIDHFIVNKLFCQLNLPNVKFYLEYPYYKRKYCQKLVNDYCEKLGYEIIPLEQDQAKIDVFRKVHKEQLYQIRFEADLADTSEYLIRSIK